MLELACTEHVTKRKGKTEHRHTTRKQLWKFPHIQHTKWLVRSQQISQNDSSFICSQSSATNHKQRMTSNRVSSQLQVRVDGVVAKIRADHLQRLRTCREKRTTKWSPYTMSKGSQAWGKLGSEEDLLKRIARRGGNSSSSNK